MNAEQLISFMMDIAVDNMTFADKLHNADRHTCEYCTTIYQSSIQTLDAVGVLQKYITY